MKKHLILYSILIFTIFIISNCGIEPPTQDLEMAKASISKAEEVEAEKFASSEYSEAKKLLVTGETNIVPEKSGKNKDAKEYLEQSNAKATEAYQKAVPKWAEFYVNDLKSSLKDGKEIKADVAAKQDFDEAKRLYNDAQQKYNNKDYLAAGKKAKAAKEVSQKAYQTATEKKTKSETAINEAKQKLEQIKQK